MNVPECSWNVQERSLTFRYVHGKLTLSVRRNTERLLLLRLGQMGNPNKNPGKPNKKSAKSKQKVGENQTKISEIQI
jgi:hypothetical protein